MNLVKCSNGHFYDSETNAICPHCSGGLKSSDNDLTVPLRHTADDEVTVPLTIPVPPISPSLQDAVNQSMKSPSSRDDNKTIGFFSSSIGKEPVVGWLVCTEGEHFGEDFRLKSGRNFIGRANGMDVSISKDTTVSRERHAIVVYEPRGNMFLMQAGDSKELCYLNEQVVLSPQTLNANDRILVGKTELMFIPCCSKDFSWEKKD